MQRVFVMFRECVQSRADRSNIRVYTYRHRPWYDGRMASMPSLTEHVPSTQGFIGLLCIGFDDGCNTCMPCSGHTE